MDVSTAMNNEKETGKEEHTDRYYIKLDAVILLLLKNDRYMTKNRSGELTEQIRETLKCSKATANRFKSDALREVRSLGKKDKDKAYKKAIRDREYLVMKYKESDSKLALDAMKDRDKLQGLYIEKTESKITLEKVNLNNLSDDQLVKLRAYIKAGMDMEEALLHIGVIIK